MRLHLKLKPVVALAMIASSFNAIAASQLVPTNIDHSKNVTIDLKSKVGLATDLYITDHNDDPTPGIITGEIYSIQGNLATGKQTVKFTLNQKSSGPIIVNEQTVTPGQQITFTTMIAEDGRLRIPYKATTDQNTKFDYSVEIPQLVSKNDKVPDLSVGDISVQEGSSGSKMVNITIGMDVKFGKPVSFSYLTNDIDTASIAGEARNLAYDHHGNPFISIVDNPNGGRLVLDAGFPKLYNGTGGTGNTWQYLANVYNWIKADNFGSGIMLLGDKPGSHGGNYRVKDHSSRAGFGSSFTTWARNNGIPLTIKDVDNFGGFGRANVSLAELKKYKAVFVMGSATVGSGGFTQSTIKAFSDYSKSGGGIMLISDHDVFQHSANQIASVFNLRFYGNVNRAPISVPDLIARYGNHPLWDGLSVIPAGGSEGNVDISAVDFSAIDYEGVGGQITFQPGETSVTVPIKIYGDTIREGNERFSIDVQNAVNANLADGQGIVTILNDD
ncbi:hypothetical protein DC915_RS02925 [Vibrio parahaemolyticus]|nr:hypothetical protein [Vibrio parahaemolyticus]EJG0009932.1 hypothetical protein [Vibrio parahaemolyticus]ELA8176761.1 hypothetical protein [Vibrio alginolyticus]